MKHLLSSAFLLLASCTCAHAWGRHDLITRKAFEGSPLERIQVTADPIDSAAEGLLLHAVPKAQDWAESYHREVDRRSAWTRPEPAPAAFVGRRLSRRQQLLWAIEDNVETPLDFSVTPSDDPAIARRPTFGAPGQPGHGRASTILEDYVVEPDAQLDNGFNAAPYFARLKDRMGLFFEGGAHTHTFRHYFVPTSLVPPLLTPQGDAPRQAAFYAELAVGAFQAGRPYWGYRFLAWSLHYAQDATQPWHTTLVPGLSFLRLSRAAIRKQVAGYHYLTEALADGWLARAHEAMPAVSDEKLGQLWRGRRSNPWFVAELVEHAARVAHDKLPELVSSARPIFSGILDKLTDALRPTADSMVLGGAEFPLRLIDFSGDGRGATSFLESLWNPEFTLSEPRTKLEHDVADNLSWAVELSRMIAQSVLERAGVAVSLKTIEVEPSL